MGCLYQLTSPSGKAYIGITKKTASLRFAKHVEHALGKRENGVLYSALRKYQPENFKIETLVMANDWLYLNELEAKVIAAFGTRHPAGYNMTDGGGGTQGPISEKARRIFRVPRSFAINGQKNWSAFEISKKKPRPLPSPNMPPDE